MHPDVLAFPSSVSYGGKVASALTSSLADRAVVPGPPRAKHRPINTERVRRLATHLGKDVDVPPQEIGEIPTKEMARGD
eukprot:9453245-Pyramimonas_sp.AAC.1